MTRLILRGNNRRRTQASKNPAVKERVTTKQEDDVAKVQEQMRPFVVEQTPTKIIVKKDIKAKSEHTVELDELTAVTQSLMELCAEVLKD